MANFTPIHATVLRRPSSNAACTCEHSVDCDHGCHDRHCDSSEIACHTDFLPDEGGLTYWGCTDCTPGDGALHYLGCELMGWNVPMAARRPTGTPGKTGHSAFL